MHFAYSPNALNLNKISLADVNHFTAKMRKKLKIVIFVNLWQNGEENHLMVLSGDLLRHEDPASGSNGKSASGSSRLVSQPCGCRNYPQKTLTHSGSIKSGDV
jgi:hypothetical protein